MTHVIYWPPTQERERQPAWEGFFRVRRQLFFPFVLPQQKMLPQGNLIVGDHFRDHYWRGLTGRSFTADRRTRLRGSGGRDPGRFRDSCISAAGGIRAWLLRDLKIRLSIATPHGYAISSTTGKSAMP
jgi:hypothetical protein